MGQTCTLIVAAMPLELTPVVRRLKLKRTADQRYADAAGAVHAAVVGVGPKRCALAIEALIKQLNPSRVIMAGLAGGLNPRLQAGDVITVGDAIDAVTGERFRSDAGAGRVVSVTQGVFTVEAKAALRQQHHADAVDMETATVACACERAGVHWQAVRAISDPADMALPPHITRMLSPTGIKVHRVMATLVRHPGAIPLLIRLGRITHRCTAALADHVARCVT